MIWTTLKAAIVTVIKTNNNQEITGAVLQNALFSIINSVGANATFAGVATPSTNPGTPDGPVFYLATEKGIYSNFNSLSIHEGISVLKYDGSSWTSEQVTYESDGIFDISTFNNDTYIDLTDALGTDGEHIPQPLRKGGMSVKFVQSSDNKYVQYRLTSDEWSVDTEDWVITEEGVYIDNPEFAHVETDVEDKIIWAIKTDGDIYYGTGCPTQVKDYIDKKLAELSLDEYEDIVSFLSDYLGSDITLKIMIDEINAQISNKLDAEGLDPEALGTVQTVENPEYIQVTTNSEDKIFEGISSDLVKHINLPIDTPSSTIEHIDNPEWLSVITDGEKKVFGGRDKDGWLVENVGIKSPTTDELNNKINIAYTSLYKEELLPIIPGDFTSVMTISEIVALYNSKLAVFAELCRCDVTSFYELKNNDGDSLLCWKINHNFRKEVVWEGMSKELFASQLNKYFTIPIYRFQDAKFGNANIEELGNINTINKSRIVSFNDREPVYVNMDGYSDKSFLCMCDCENVPPMNDGVLANQWRIVERNENYPIWEANHLYKAPFSYTTEPSTLIVENGNKIRLYSASGIFTETEDGINWSTPVATNIGIGHPSINYVDGIYMNIYESTSQPNEGVFILRTSNDGITFTNRGIIKGTKCGVDDIGNGHTLKYLGNSYLFKDYDGTYYLFYEGLENDNPEHPKWELCLMTCTDIFIDNGDGTIGNWVQAPTNPIIPSLKQGAEGNLYAGVYGPGNPEIVKGEDNQPIKYDGKYYMYFHCQAGSIPSRDSVDVRIERAYSYDLIHWVREGSIIANMDEPDYGDHSDHAMCQFKGRTYLFYTVGINSNNHRTDTIRYVIDDRPLIEMLKIKA